MRLAAYSTAHFAFAETFASKHVPDEYQPILRECFAGYDYAFHGVAGNADPNLRAFDDHPEVGDYLLDRMVLVGTRRVPRAGRAAPRRRRASTGSRSRSSRPTTRGASPPRSTASGRLKR